MGLFRKQVGLFLCLMAGFLFVACDSLVSGDEMGDPSMAYHFDEPAAVWEETLPLGNGRIGMMPDGGIEKETYVLNEISMWSGSKQETDNPEALKALPEIRRLLFAGKNDEAQELMYKTFVCKGEGSGRGHGYSKPYGAYQLFGNLEIDYVYPDNGTSGSDSEPTITDYCRELQLDQAQATVSFTRNGITYKREAFTSFDSDLGVIRLTANKAKSLHLMVGMNRRSNATQMQCYDAKTRVSGEVNPELLFSGRLPAGTEDSLATEGQGMRYSAKVQVLLPKGGELKAGADGQSLEVRDASEVILLIGMATDYAYADIARQLTETTGLPDVFTRPVETADVSASASASASADDAASRRVDALFVAVEGVDYTIMKRRHTEVYRKLFARVGVDFGRVAEKERMPINKRLAAFQEDKNDPSLLALYYQLGRYLLISSTRPGLLPPNLQGLWCNTINTPWNGDYHLNINVQMNLWPAETGNLPELHLPLIAWTKQQVESGRKTARAFYDARGWVTHILGNVWEFTAPGEHPSWGATNTSAAWLCEHLYQHYQYTQDKKYLAEVYPVLKGAALFFVDMLVEDPRSRYLVTAPTTSPENAYILPNGKRANVCAGSTMDNQILRELFANTIEAASVLGIDASFADTLAEKRSRLQPTAIGPDGRLMEWLEPFEEAEPTHRHVSHLYGLHPANEISIVKTPELAEAARKSLVTRGDQSTGWSMAWKVNFWARLYDGEHAFKLLTDLLQPCMEKGVNMSNGGGTYPNLFCAHPPYQIDGNFGGCAGIAEMLIQSHAGFIDLLPALPAAWKTGSFEGLCVQGGGEVSASWKEGLLQSVTLRSKTTHTFRIKLPDGYSTGFSAKLNNEPVSLSPVDGMVSVAMKPGDVFYLNP